MANTLVKLHVYRRRIDRKTNKFNSETFTYVLKTILTQTRTQTTTHTEVVNYYRERQNLNPMPK